MKQANSYSISDKTGIISAVLCTIHCMIVPLLVLLQGIYTGAVKTLPAWWGYIDLLFLAISFWAVYHSAKHTGSNGIKTGLWASWLVLATAIICEPLHWLTYIASAGLITVHTINIRRMMKLAADPA